LGEIAFGCFQAAKILKSNPAQVAIKLQSELLKKSDIFSNVQNVGPYINLKLAPGFYQKHLVQGIFNQEAFKGPWVSQAPKTMIEFSQPNTHKELHVGHMRNACLGDSLVKLHKYCGYEIISSTFPGDVGTHVAKCLWYLKFRNTEAVPTDNKGEWLGRIYSKANLQLEDEEKTEKNDLNQKQLAEILKQIEAHRGEFFELWRETRQWSVDLMNHVYAWIDVQFDKWYWESDVDAVSIQYVKKLYQDKKLIESQGAIGMDLSDQNLGFCMLLKSNGTGLYATKDLELARRKFEDFNIQKNIYVVDMRQALHFKQVFATLDKLGFQQAKDCFHLQYNFVELPDGAMSSRKGNIVPLMKLVSTMQDHIKSTYLAKFQNEWTAQETQLIAKQVAMGAIKYGMLKIDPNKKIVFDMNEWIKIDGDSGPFIQYSVARIKSLKRKISTDQSYRQSDLSSLVHKTEKNLLGHLFFFNSTVVLATTQYRPSVLCTYLFQLAQKFNAFYHDCPIATAESPQLKSARLALADAVGQVLEKGLSLLGIPSPEKM
jgi:arginyl-tRNA synthetase